MYVVNGYQNSIPSIITDISQYVKKNQMSNKLLGWMPNTQIIAYEKFNNISMTWLM